MKSIKTFSICFPLLIFLSVTHLGISQNIPQNIPIEGLMGWWPFNGDAQDESGNGNHGQVFGSILTTDRFEQPLSAFEFDGTNHVEIDHSEMLDFSVQQDYTISAWFKIGKNYNGGSIIEKWNGVGSYPYHIRSYDLDFFTPLTAGRFIGGPENSERAPASTIDTTVWRLDSNFNHIVAVFSPFAIKIYMNGILTAVDTTKIISGEIQNNTVLTIGRRRGRSDRHFEGKIDDIGIWDRALTEKEIWALYDSNSTTALCKDIPTVELPCTDLPIYSSPSTSCGLEIVENENALGGEIPGFTYGGTFEGHHYYIYNEPTNWTTGEALCRANGGYLVCVNSEAENEFITSLTSANIWIGLYRDSVTCEYKWVNCEELAYTRWASGEPNNQPCGEPYVQIINGCSFNNSFWNNLGNNSANGACHSNMFPILEVDPAFFRPIDHGLNENDIDAGTDNWNIYFQDSLTLENVALSADIDQLGMEIISTEEIVDNCGIGKVTRSFRVYDRNSDEVDTCQMSVSFWQVQNYIWTLPKDQSFFSCQYTCATEEVYNGFENCELEGFFPYNFDRPGSDANANIVDGLEGCGVQINRPNGLISQNNNYGYGTYTLMARSGSSISNQGFAILENDSNVIERLVQIDVRQNGTDDSGWAFHINGDKMAEGGRNSVPSRYPNWYQIKLEVTPSYIAFSIDSTIMYEATDHELELECERLAISTFSSSIFDNFNYKPLFKEDKVDSEIKSAIESTGCDLFTYATSYTIVDPRNNFCYGVEQVNRMLNWCEYNGGEQPWVIDKGESSQDPLRLAVSYAGEEEDQSQVAVQLLNSIGVVQDSLTLDDYQNDRTSPRGFLIAPNGENAGQSKGFFEVLQFIEVIDDQPPVMSILDTQFVFSNYKSSDDCNGTVNFSIFVSDECTQFSSPWEVVAAFADLNITQDQSEFIDELNIEGGITIIDSSILFLNQDLPLGTHIIVIQVADLCGNTQVVEQEVTIVDQTPPIPLCQMELMIDLSVPDGDYFPEATLVMEDALLGAGSDCSGIYPAIRGVKLNQGLELGSIDEIYLDLRELSGIVEITFTATQRSGIFHNIIIPEVDTFAENSGSTTIVLEGGRIYGPCLPYSNFSGTNLYIGNEVVNGISTSGSYTNQSIICEEGGDDWEDMVLTVNQGIFIRLSIKDLIGVNSLQDFELLASELIFDCTELGINNVPVFVADIEGNIDYCISKIEVLDPQNLCANIVGIKGEITSYNSHPFAEVTLNLNNELQTKTDLNGRYLYQELELDGNYTVAPSRDGSWLEGVSTKDLVMITQHILVVENLVSPYQLLAADVDGSGYISTYDIVQLRQLILSNKTDIDNNTSWKFIPSDYVFPNPKNPWMEEIPESIYFEKLSGIGEANFIAIKTGDVDLSSFNGVEPRSAEPLKIIIAEEELGNGLMAYHFSTEQSSFKGFQLELLMSDAELVSLKEHQLSMEHFGLSNLEESKIYVSWNGVLSSNELFQLVVHPTGRRKVDFEISNQKLMPEVYWDDRQYGAVVLEPDWSFIQDEIANVPNPFRNFTDLKFNQLKTGKTEIKIMDVSGKIIYNKTYTLNKGMHTVRIERSDLEQPGLYFYQVSQENYSKTEKMILVD